MIIDTVSFNVSIISLFVVIERYKIEEIKKTSSTIVF